MSTPVPAAEGARIADVFLRIIEEFADGFLILNEEGRIVFFNDVLLRTMGLRSQDILTREQEFLRALGVLDGRGVERSVELPDRDSEVRSYAVTSLSVDAVRGAFLLVRVKPAATSPLTPRRTAWEQLFANLGDPVLTVDLAGTITSANPAFYRLVGYDPREELPNISAIFIHPAELEDKLMRLAEAGTVDNLETHLASREGQLHRVLDTSWVARDERGTLTGYTSHLKDITYVKNLEARLKISERNYIVLFDTILSSIIIVDPFGRILKCNYSAEQMYGYRWQELAGRDFDEVFQVHKKSRPLAEIIAQAERNHGKLVETDVPRKCKDTTIKFTYAAYTALVNSEGKTIAWSVMERDLTDRVRLEKKLKISYDQIKETQGATILGFAHLTEYRDKDTGKHLERIRDYTKVIAAGLARLPKYADYIDADYIEDLCLSSVLHDVGKVAIEDAILLKRDRLTPEEFERMKQHTKIGGEALRAVDAEIKRESFLTIGKEIAYYHHERWDGTGYPAKRGGEDIPLSARIVALADVYDALTSKRPYHEPISHEEAVKIIASERGTHFDPDVVDVFLAEQEAFQHIRKFDEMQEHPESIDDLIAGAPAAPGS